MTELASDQARTAIGDPVPGFHCQTGLDIGDSRPAIVALNYATSRMTDAELAALLGRLRDRMPPGAFVRIAEADMAHPGRRYRAHNASTLPLREVGALCRVIESVGMVPRIVECWRNGTLTTNRELIKLAPIQRSALLDRRFHDPAMRLTSLIVDALVDRYARAVRYTKPEILDGFHEIGPADPRAHLRRVGSVEELQETPNSYVDLPYVQPVAPEWPECVPAQAVERMKVCHIIKTWPLTRTLAPMLARTDDTLVSLAPNAEGTLVWRTCIFREPGYFGLVSAEDRTVKVIDHRYFINSDAGKTVAIPEMAVFFDGNVRYYSHWLGDALLPLFMLRNAGVCGPQAILPGRMPRFVNESLALLGIPLVTLAEGTQWARIERAFWVARNRTPIYCTDDLVKLGGEMRDRAGPGPSGQRILIERQNVRRIVNHDELAHRLAGLGFVSVRLEEMAFADQVRLFAGSECVVGPHGAGLTNVMFCKPGTRVVEIMPDRDHRPHFWAISHACGLPYTLVEAPAVSRAMEMVVDVDTVESVVRRMLG